MICQNCNNKFPSWILIQGKKRNLSSRKYCLDCTPFGSHNTQVFVNGKLERVAKTISVKKKTKSNLNKFNWELIQNFYNSGGTWREIVKTFSITNHLLAKAVKLNLLKTNKHRKQKENPNRKLSQETKNKIREARLRWLKANPNEKSWRDVQGKESAPCKFVKEFLSKNNIIFESELQPLLHKDRYFSIDIAFPDKMIAWEINGNQHYDTNGNLKPYYQERHDLIEKEGWVLIEIRYWNAFKEDFLLDLIHKYNLK